MLRFITEIDMIWQLKINNLQEFFIITITILYIQHSLKECNLVDHWYLQLTTIHLHLERDREYHLQRMKVLHHLDLCCNVLKNQISKYLKYLLKIKNSNQFRILWFGWNWRRWKFGWLCNNFFSLRWRNISLFDLSFQISIKMSVINY